jgi:exosortase H (IPTLxxWG-CTERM-specific)
MKRSPNSLSRSPTRAARLRFLIVFGLICFVFVGIYQFPYADRSWPLQIIGFCLRSYARVAGAVLALLDRTVSVSGVEITGRFPLKIVRSCDASEAMALVVAAILAFPATWRRRLVGIAAGVGAIFVVNVARICGLYFIGVARPDMFDFAHQDIWPLFVVATAAVVFMGWARWAQGTDSGRKTAAT